MNANMIRFYVSVIALLLLTSICVKRMQGPGNLLEMWSSHYAEPLKNGQIVKNQTTVDSLYTEYLFKQSLLQVSSEDSIQLVLNIAESKAHLCIKGVPIFTSEIIVKNDEPLVRKLNAATYAQVFGSPLLINEISTTIIKEPIVEMQAPKTPEEAVQNAYMPDTLIQNPAFLAMHLENGLRLRLVQAGNETWQDFFTRIKFNVQFLKADSKAFLQALLTFQPYVYQPEWIVILPKDDIRTIYRALPNQAYVVLKPV